MNKMLGYLMLGYLMLGAMPALAQLGLGMVGMTVDQAVAEIRKNYETAFSATEASASRSMFDARTHALVVLGQLDLIASKRGAELFRNLREAEKQIFLRADELLRKIGTNAENLTADMQSLANTAENMVGGILGSVPRLRSISPSFAIADGREVRFKAGGNFLDYGPASLELAGVPCMPERLITTESIFRCKMPGSAPTLGHFLPGTLTVYLERTWWQALTFREGDQRKIPVGLTALGSTIGTLTVLADGQRDTETRNSRSQTIGHRNDHCSGDTHLSPSFNPASPSCRIVASSIKVHERSRSSNSVNGGLRSVSETGFQWSGIARNNGSCGPRVFGQRVGLDGRGWVEVDITWDEICTSTVAFSNENVGSRDIGWNESFEMPLPPGTVDVRWSAASELGSDVGQGNQPGKYFTAELSTGKSSVQFRTRDVSEVLK